MNIEKLRELRQQGNEIEDLIYDLIFSGKITQSEIANAIGQSEAQVSMILNPNHQAAFHIRHLPILMKLLDGEAIARAICNWIGRVPALISTDKINIGKAEIKKELLNVISAVEQL